MASGDRSAPRAARAAHVPHRSASGQPFDDPQVAVDGLAEHLQSGLIAGPVVGGGRLVHAVEFDDHHALGEPGLIGLGGSPAGQKAPAASGNGRARELGILRQGIRIRNRPIGGHPIRLCHCDLSIPIRCTRPMSRAAQPSEKHPAGRAALSHNAIRRRQTGLGDISSHQRRLRSEPRGSVRGLDVGSERGRADTDIAAALHRRAVFDLATFGTH